MTPIKPQEERSSLATSRARILIMSALALLWFKGSGALGVGGLFDYLLGWAWGLLAGSWGVLWVWGCGFSFRFWWVWGALGCGLRA